MSSRVTRTGHARPGPTRLREKVSLFPTLAISPVSEAAVEARELWAGVHLPWLAIEALDAGADPKRALPNALPGPDTHTRSPESPPRAIVEVEGQTQYITAVCPRAQRSGVRAGMSMAAALALVPGLVTRSRDLTREQQLLDRLATRSHRFTPRVSLVPPDGLVLEVKGSLHLFGGAQGLCNALVSDFQKAGVNPLVALAPTPLAALAGARAGRSFVITEPAHLIGQIVSLPLLALRWPADVLDRLKQVGVYTAGQALRLPRAGFARRFGKAHLAELDRLTGRDTDLRKRYQLSERFRRKQDVVYELEHHAAILATLEPALEELGAFLKARQCGISRLDCLLTHRQAPPTRCVLRLAAPAANAQHFMKLLGEKLSTVTLPEPVRSCELRSGPLVSRALAADSLWQPGEHGGGASAAAPELIEHLRARLGHESVYGLRVLESHRPETAWAPADLRSTSKATSDATAVAHVPWPAHRRPLWLLPTPESLSERDGLPNRHGALRLLEGPECIETSWWDGGVERDYYVALDAHGVRLWLFRERTMPRGWFLHGLFG